MRTLSSILVLCLLVAACKGSSGPTVGKDDAGTPDPACVSFSVCGGDIVGKWRWTANCRAPMQVTDDCDTAPIQIDLSHLNDVYEYRSDGTVQDQTSGVLREAVRYTKGCITPVRGNRIAATCDDLEVELRSWAGEQVTALDCLADSTGGCVCTYAYTYTGTTSFTHNYTIHGDQLIPNPDGSDPAIESYCVSGDTLVIQSEDYSSINVYKKVSP